tara:strand:- start:80 stop:658 length:579 start_codon:yes stop_codon:yes gene_type:complete
MNATFNAPLVLLMQNFFSISFLILLGICIYLYKLRSKYFLALLPLLALSIHQVEEYVLSPFLFGDYYHFLNWAFRNGMDISPMEVMLINLAPYLILLPALIITRAQSKNIFGILFLFNNGLTMANASFHIGISTAQNLFSPGMVSSLFFYIPLFIYGILFNKEIGLGNKPIIAISLYGFVGHYILIWLINIF